MRIPRFWKDVVYEFPKRFRITSEGQYAEIQREPGETIVDGTPQNEANFNNMDMGIVEAAMTALFTADMQHKADRSIAGLTGERIELTLTNGQSYPFNNSKRTVALGTSRNTKDYTVDVEVTGYTGGGVGDIEISDKLLNGFKIGHTGGASSVDVICTVRGGI